MARLAKERWEEARAEYEVRGVSLGEIAKRLNVNVSSVSRKARAEGWKQGQMQELVDRKVAAVKELAQIETQTQELPLHFRHTIETVAREKLEEAGYTASFGKAIARRGMELAASAMPDELETLSRAHKNISPQAAPREGTTVNVHNQQAAIQPLSPRDALAEVVRQAAETPLGEGNEAAES